MPPPNTATRLQVDTLVEPVVKQVAKWGCESSDFDMFVDVAKHPRLHLRAALRLLDLLGKVRTAAALFTRPPSTVHPVTLRCQQVCLHDPAFSRVAVLPFLHLSKRFHENPVMQQYLRQFTQVALAGYVAADDPEDENEDRPDGQPSPALVKRVMVQETLAKVCVLPLTVCARALVISDMGERCFRRRCVCGRRSCTCASYLWRRCSSRCCSVWRMTTPPATASSTPS